jgi:hypothetical protein
MHTITAERLRGATSENDVVEVVREYLSDWLPEEIGRLPADCRPGKLRDAEDLSTLAYNLTQACVSFDLDARDLEFVEEMDVFLSHACRRVAEIHHHGNSAISASPRATSVQIR